MEVNVVQVEDLVEFDTLVIDGAQSSVTDFGEEGNTLET